MTETVVQPVSDNIVVKIPKKAETRTTGGIYIPESVSEEPQVAKVVAVGPGRYSEFTGNIIPMAINVGDSVVFAKYGGIEVKAGSETVTILKQTEILATIKTEEKNVV